MSPVCPTAGNVRRGDAVQDVPVAVAGPPDCEVGPVRWSCSSRGPGCLRPGPTARRAASAGAVDDVPRAVRGSPHRHVGPAVTAVVTRDRDVAELPHAGLTRGCRGAVDDVPVAVGGTPDGEVGLAVAVVVTGDRDVADLAPLPGRVLPDALSRTCQVPSPAATPRTGSPRAGSSGRDGDVADRAPLDGLPFLPPIVRQVAV